jgi:hypothetical protein
VSRYVFSTAVRHAFERDFLDGGSAHKEVLGAVYIQPIESIQRRWRNVQEQVIVSINNIQGPTTRCTLVPAALVDNSLSTAKLKYPGHFGSPTQYSIDNDLIEISA